MSTSQGVFTEQDQQASKQENATWRTHAVDFYERAIMPAIDIGVLVLVIVGTLIPLLFVGAGVFRLYFGVWPSFFSATSIILLIVFHIWSFLKITMFSM